MKIAITHFYSNTSTDAWSDVIDTSLLPPELATQLINALPQGSIELSYSTMQKELANASVTKFPCEIEGCMTVHEV